MNKTININLGGYPFTIDEDAFDTANGYLHTLTRHFGNGEGAEEIMQDIENRMGELINRKKGMRTIVNRIDILDAIAVLGTPEELKDIDFSASASSSKRSSGSFELKTGKRLYRDLNDKVLGGVCSGLSAYFGIHDTVWIRIAFALFTMLGGAGVIIYFVLWAVVPPARTVSDRLEMMGEPTNVNNIARLVKEELEEFGDKMQEKFGRKQKHHSYQQHKHADDDEILTSGWSWDFRCGDKKKKPFNHKDFV